MLNKVMWTAAKYLLAVSVLVYVVHSNWEPTEGRGLSDVWQRHVIDGQPIHATFLLLAFALHSVSFVTTLLRWYLLVRAQDLPFTMLAAMRIGALGALCNAFLPGAVGGDLVKAAALAREQDRQTVAVATVIIDRAMSLWGLIFLVAVIGSASFLFDLLDASALATSQVVIIAAGIIVGLSALLWFGMGLCSPDRIEQWAGALNRVPKIGASLAQFWQALWLYRNRPASIAWAIALSTLSNVCDILAFYCYVRTLWDGSPANPIPSVTEHFLLVPVGLVISGVPLFPGGAGIGEAGFGGLYVLFGAAAASGVLGSLIFRVSGWTIGILGYLVCLLIPAQAQG